MKSIILVENKVYYDNWNVDVQSNPDVDIRLVDNCYESLNDRLIDLCDRIITVTSNAIVSYRDLMDFNKAAIEYEQPLAAMSLAEPFAKFKEMESRKNCIYHIIDKIQPVVCSLECKQLKALVAPLKATPIGWNATFSIFDKFTAYGMFPVEATPLDTYFTCNMILGYVEKPLASVVVIYQDSDKHWLHDMSASLPNWVELVLVETKYLGDIDSKKVSGAELNNVKVNHDTRTTIAEFNYFGGLDFSAARNAAKSLATGRYIISLDADERLVAAQHRQLKDILIELERPAKADVWGIINRSYNWSNLYKDAKGFATAQVPVQCRIFRNIPEIYWVSKIHESVDVIINEQGKVMLDSSILFIHEGYKIDKEAMLLKLDRNINGLLSQPELLDKYNGVYRDRLIETIQKREEIIKT